MAGIFKKAMGLFVEFEEEPQKSSSQSSSSSSSSSSTPPPIPNRVTPNQVLNGEELDKFEKHFEKLFDQANLPGPDYYEFMKMTETLEAHIKDENARFAATYASLAIQGLTKEKLVETANAYKQMVGQDKVQFEKSVNAKSELEIGQKRKDLQKLEESVKQHAETIQRLTKEISEAQISMGNLKAVITEEEHKLARNKQGYVLACDAMVKKITDDITKIQTTL